MKRLFKQIKHLFSVPLVNISVVEGRPAELPCDITPPGEDTLHMVFWFKDEAGVPLYTKFRDSTTPSQDLRHHDGVSLEEQRAEGIYANAPGRAQALNPLFIAAISLEKYSEARGHIDVACVRAEEEH
ncbi:hypothetical protein ALC57_03509 [Trachymyrmex cornetzi]|uniref:Ig-like domain-containing protein n=1 Tax=Trachymyrmex cornetzi TaxID=471704 RepID=A0A195EG86_9HYME|nr:hypothetical protein ALC57_03509 [Trachymyrmex cornetzi]